MSLLIKALDKAEQGKKTEEQTPLTTSELSLEPVGGGEPLPHQASELQLEQPQASQHAASTVFAAKQTRAKPGSARNVLLIAAIAFFVMLLIGFQIYNYIQSLSQPELIMPKPVAAVAPSPQPAQPVEPTVLASPANPEASIAEENLAPQAAAKEPVATDSLSAASAPADRQPKGTKPEPMTFGEPIAERRDTSMQISKNNIGPRVSPELMAGYRAFNAGDDVEAQELYRKVLRTDLRNVDALLGMAAIAQRQGRLQDAMGWYGKVLEVEPRNPVAQAAMVNAVSQGDPITSESRIKSLLVQQPNAANLHAALGSLYTERGQWPAAQQSYFEAHRLDPGNPEYAFNLAVSLDQLGKPALALEYYKKTLELIQRNTTTTIDRQQLESRIIQLQ
jgi:tetratricopeptide (TPR) repeat protein